MRSRRGCVLTGYSWTLRRPSFSSPQPAVFISCRSQCSQSAQAIFHQLLPFETWNIHRQWCLDEVLRHENIVDLLLCAASSADYPSVSVEICSSVAGVVSRPLVARLWQFDTRRRFITSLFMAAVSDECRRSAYVFPSQSASASLRSFVSCTGWTLQSRLHSNK